MSLTKSEIENLRAHLRHGNIGVGASPYTSDGFYSLFDQVIAPNLSTDTETTSVSPIAAGIASCTPLVMTNIVVAATLVVDIGEDAEIVEVKAVNGGSFVARFAKAHDLLGYPVLVMSGKARLRFLLGEANRAFSKAFGSSITQTAGLKQLGQGEIEWLAGGRGVINDVLFQYAKIMEQISELVRVSPNLMASRRGSSLEVY